jgi:hypothetical protein
MEINKKIATYQFRQISTKLALPLDELGQEIFEVVDSFSHGKECLKVLIMFINEPVPINQLIENMNIAHILTSLGSIFHSSCFRSEDQS